MAEPGPTGARRGGADMAQGKSWGDVCSHGPVATAAGLWSHQPDCGHISSPVAMSSCLWLCLGPGHGASGMAQLGHASEKGRLSAKIEAGERASTHACPHGLSQEAGWPLIRLSAEFQTPDEKDRASHNPCRYGLSLSRSGLPFPLTSPPPTPRCLALDASLSSESWPTPFPMPSLQEL